MIAKLILQWKARPYTGIMLSKTDYYQISFIADNLKVEFDPVSEVNENTFLMKAISY